MSMRYDLAVTGPTVNGRGNPGVQGAQWPRQTLSRPFRVHRLCTPMAAPGGASLGWAGSLYPVFHPRSCAATLTVAALAPLARGTP